MVQVAVAQFAPDNDKLNNLAQIKALVAEAAGRGSRLVVLPEYAAFTVAVTDHQWVDTAETLDGPFVTALRSLAAEHRTTLVAGMNESLTDDRARISNTLVALGPDGAQLATYRKLHLYDAFGYRESDVVRAGDITEPPTFVVEGLTFGLQTCYDLRFPEVTRRLVDAGVDAVLVPAEWVPGPLKEDHWMTLVRARALENTIYLAAAGQNAPTGCGNSVIVDPMGVVLASLGERTGTTGAELSRDRVADVRAKNPALKLRRFTVAVRD